MAGFTPFQFSSDKLQATNSMVASTDPSKKSLLSDTIGSMTSWYEMWINPMSVHISDPFIQQTEHTAGSIVTYHYRKDLAVMEVKGIAGWVAIQSDLEQMQSNAFTLLRSPSKGIKGLSQNLKSAKNNFLSSVNPLNKATGASNSLNNSPRKFLERLRTLAYEPTYYFDRDGREHYNNKYIKMYTKQYPQGVICEGFFKQFNIPESEEDVQTIHYSFTFIVQDMQPVTLIQKVAGMFAPAGSVVGGVVGMI